MKERKNMPKIKWKNTQNDTTIEQERKEEREKKEKKKEEGTNK